MMIKPGGSPKLLHSSYHIAETIVLIILPRLGNRDYSVACSCPSSCGYSLPAQKLLADDDNDADADDDAEADDGHHLPAVTACQLKTFLQIPFNLKGNLRAGRLSILESMIFRNDKKVLGSVNNFQLGINLGLY